MNIEEIIWPCLLPTHLKTALLDISVIVTDFSGIKINIDYLQLDGVFYIHSGNLLVGYSAEETNTSLGTIFGQSTWLGSSSLFSTNNFIFLAEELTPIKMLYFPKAKIESIAEQEPSLYKMLFEIMKQNAPRYLLSSLSFIHGKHIKLAYTLYNYLKLATNETMFVPTALTISQQQLSTITGISRPRVNEVLKSFEKEGIIYIQRGKVIVEDQKKLRKKFQHINILSNVLVVKPMENSQVNYE
ncbi:Crp/Fnr family transcriptional regulator [Vibrio artabrorum]|uniref:Crp/Fnr family transcriptional regulator n=1 Tax=Vibrio artabrorum TaxID=446374 RepID=UPI0035526462